MKRGAAAVGLGVCLAIGVPMAQARVEGHHAKDALVSIQLLAINDYHGSIEAPAGDFFGQPAGGGEYLATHLAALKAQNPNTLIVSGGDMFGASLPLSALFHDEPAIETLNAMGLQVSVVGTHEFDQGVDELLRLQRGGCHPKDGCKDGDPFEGADYDYLAANVEIKLTSAQVTAHARALAAFRKARAAFRNARTSLRKQIRAKRRACRKDARSAACLRKVRPVRPFSRKRPTKPTPRLVLPPTKVLAIGGIRIGFVGVSLGGAPEIANLQVVDPAATTNRYAAALKKQGVNAIVVLVHQGGVQRGGLNDCVGLSGPIVDTVNGLSKDIDVVITGNTHVPFVCFIRSKLVTNAAAYGRVVTDIDLTVESTSGDVVTKRAVNTIVPHTIAKDPEVAAIVEKYKRLAGLLVHGASG